MNKMPSFGLFTIKVNFHKNQEKNGGENEKRLF